MLLVRKAQWKLVNDVKVIPSETVALQHKPLVATLQLRRFQKRELCSTETRIRCGKLRGPKGIMFKQKALASTPLIEPIMSAQTEWMTLKTALVEAAEEVCGRAKYGKKPDREEWWWSSTVQSAVERKKVTRKELELRPSVQAREDYKQASNEAKKAVRQAKDEAKNELYDELETRPEVARKKIYKLAKERRGAEEDNIASPFINNDRGQLIVDGPGVKDRWKEYFGKLLNEENPFSAEIPTTPANVAPQLDISLGEVKKAISKMKCGKAPGPDEVNLEMILALGNEGELWVHRVMQAIWKEKRVPDDWLESILVPIFKKKGNIHECGNYRGIKLLSQVMKCLEKIMDARIRLYVHEQLGEEQFGFRQGRGTTDALFIFRQLMER